MLGSGGRCIGPQVGIAAAGGLAFWPRTAAAVRAEDDPRLVQTMAPLQRAAERLAEKAVPVTASVPSQASGPTDASHPAYRRAVRLAMRDRRLTHVEELELAHLAEELGIGAGTAMMLRQEVQGKASEAFE